LHIAGNSAYFIAYGPLRLWATTFNLFERAELAGVNVTLIKLVTQDRIECLSCTMSLIESNLIRRRTMNSKTYLNRGCSRYTRKTMSLSDERTKLIELQKLADAIPTERGRELGRKICTAIKENAAE